MDLGLRGKAALVSGASKGIGRAIAERLAAEGMQVLGVARSGCDAPGVIGHACDLRDPATPDAAVAAAVARFGRLDRLVNSAGATQRGDFTTLTDAAWDDSFAGKFFAAVRLTRAAWPHLKAAGGSVACAANGVSVNEAGGGERTAAGARAKCEGSELAQVVSGAKSDANDLGGVSGNGADA